MEKKKKMPVWTIVLIVITCCGYLFFVSLFFDGLFYDLPNIFETTNAKVQENDKDFIIDGKFTISKDTLKGEYHPAEEINEEDIYMPNLPKYIITGYITNTTKKDYSYIDLEFKLFDKNGHVLGTAIISVSDVKAGETWRFKAEFDDYDAEDVYEFKIRNISYSRFGTSDNYYSDYWY